MSEDLEVKTKRRRKKQDGATGVLQYPNQIKLRDENGLLSGVNYIKNDLGFIDWRAMINEEHVILDRMKYAKEGIDVSILSDEELLKIKAEAPESKKLIRLAGFREVAKLRGIQSQTFDLVHRTDATAIVSCQISFIPNYENPTGLIVEALGQASLENTTPGSEYQKYLEAIASNRAVTRCVKEALQIFVLGEEEIVIPDNITVASARPGSPLDLLQKTCVTHNLKIDDLLLILGEIGVDIKEDWITLESLPTSVIATLIPKIKKQAKDKKEEVK